LPASRLIGTARPGQQDVVPKYCVVQACSHVDGSLGIWIEQATGTGPPRVELEEHVLQFDVGERQGGDQRRTVTGLAMGDPHPEPGGVDGLDQQIEVVVGPRAHGAACAPTAAERAFQHSVTEKLAFAAVVAMIAPASANSSTPKVTDTSSGGRGSWVNASTNARAAGRKGVDDADRLALGLCSSRPPQPVPVRFPTTEPKQIRQKAEFTIAIHASHILKKNKLPANTSISFHFRARWMG
jgi:hypothetical protein